MLKLLFAVLLIAIVSTATVPPVACASPVAPYRGAVRLFVDGRPYCGMIRSGFKALQPDQFAQAGVRVFAPVSTPSAGFWEAPVETGPGVFDYTSVDQLLASIVDASPDGRIILRTDISAPEWWRNQHPNDLVWYHAADGTIKPLMLPRPDSNGLQKYPAKTMPSWSSPDWQSLTEDAFGKLVKHIQASKYASNVIGYLIGTGESHEWFAWGNEVDASPIDTTMFRRYLTKKYATDAALQTSWADPNVTLGTAQTPTTDQITHASLGYLRDPRKEQQAIDYQAHASQVEANALLGIASAIKKASFGRAAVGAFYGYEVMDIGIWGHNGLTTVLNSNAIDFLVSPLLYWEHRRLETGTPGPMVPIDSVRLHGKLWISETDLWTSVSQGTSQTAVKDVATDTVIQRRNMAWVLPNAVAHWWFTVSGISYDNPDLMKEIGNEVSIAKRALECDASSVDEVAFVIDEQSAFYHINSRATSDFMRLSMDGLFRSGAQVGMYNTSDLPRLHNKKVFVFPNLLAPTPEIRKEIELLKRAGRTLVFFDAPGVYKDGALDLGAAAALTGIHLTQVPTQMQTVTLDDASAKALGMTGGVKYGPAFALEPGTRVAGKTGLTAYGTLPDGGIGFAVRKADGWTSVFSAAGQLPPSLWQAIFRAAGVHIYAASGDILHASGGCVGITANSAGTKTIVLPGAKHVTEAFSGQDFGVTDRVSLPMEDLQTAILLMR